MTAMRSAFVIGGAEDGLCTVERLLPIRPSDLTSSVSTKTAQRLLDHNENGVLERTASAERMTRSWAKRPTSPTRS